MELFENSSVNLHALRRKAFNYRWATHPIDVIPLTAADPDFPVAKEITKAIIDYTKDGYLSYGSPKGMNEFQKAIQVWYNAKKCSSVNADFILPVNSTAFALFVVARAILDENQHAIIPDPVDFLFRKSIENTKAKVITCNLRKDDATFHIDELRDTIRYNNVRAIFICNPNNPLGKMLSKKHLNELILIAKEFDLWIVSDEIWGDIEYDVPFVSLLDDNLIDYDKKIVVSGLSKNFALSGLRIGYIITTSDKSFNTVLKASQHETTAFGIPPICQAAGTAALTNAEYWLKAFKTHLVKMKNMTDSFIAESGFLINNNANATYLAFPSVVNTKASSHELVGKILKHAKVALVPGGTQWFESQSEGHVRICYSTSTEILSEAFDRILSVKNKLL